MQSHCPQRWCTRIGHCGILTWTSMDPHKCHLMHAHAVSPDQVPANPCTHAPTRTLLQSTLPQQALCGHVSVLGSSRVTSCAAGTTGQEVAVQRLPLSALASLICVQQAPWLRRRRVLRLPNVVCCLKRRNVERRARLRAEHQTSRQRQSLCGTGGSTAHAAYMNKPVTTLNGHMQLTATRRTARMHATAFCVLSSPARPLSDKSIHLCWCSSRC